MLWKSPKAIRKPPEIAKARHGKPARKRQSSLENPPANRQKPPCKPTIRNTTMKPAFRLRLEIRPCKAY